MFTIKKIGAILGLCALLLGPSVYAQTSHNHAPGRTCYAHDKLQEQLQQDPSMQQRMNDLEDLTQRYIQNNGYSRNQTRTIPVYVHVLYKTSQENISDAQIQSQLDQLNADFAATNADYNPPSDFSAVAAGNTGIQFTLAGITRKSTNKPSWGTNDAMKKSSRGGVDPITPATHLNMWVCNIGGGILGYAQFPGGSASTDGVVMSPQYFGSINYGSGLYLSSPFDKGRTTTHEVGHYLNLRHIWGDGGCSADDYVGDTPIAGAANYGCPSSTQNSCSGGLRDMHMNYMDYSDDACMFMFSAGQSARMWACLTSSRAQLGTSGGGSGGGGGTCSDNEVTLNLNFDNYASETSWTLKNSSGQTVASGSGYSNGDASITETFCLPAGCYDFTINDSYGDGICCSYGNGSYSLVSEGTTLASGASFTSSETKQICVGPPACTDVTLSLVFDNYGSETSWDLKDNTGQVVESGSGYTNSSADVNETFCLPAGCYDFTIYDSYGDGICCSYGNGSYSLTSGGSTLASGASFGSSETKQICVGGGARGTGKTVSTTAANVVPMEMNLYPNPANNVLNIDILNNKGTCVGRIMDATGKTLWTGDLESGNNQVNLNQLVSGIYYFNAVKADGTTVTKKFVKN